MSAIAPQPAPPQPVGMAPAQGQLAYPAAPAPVGSTQGSVDYLDTPNLAGTGTPPQTLRAPPEMQPMPAATNGARRLPMIDSDEAMGVQPLTIPSEGVNMDAELGAEPMQGAADGGQGIAEGNASEPVVDGIGTDNPMQTNEPALPPPAAEREIARQSVWSDGSPVRAPQRLPEEQEVAMIPRPENPMVDAPPPAAPDVMPTSELACRRELKRMGVIFSDKPRISNGPSCGIDYPISLQGLSGNIGVRPAVTLNCQVTLAFAKWVKNELAPSARYRYWSGVRTIVPLGGYSCRRMNNSRQRYNPMSEHAHGNAIDVGKFVLKNGHEIDVRKKGLFSFREGRLLKAVRSDSCRYFNTVLGPGSNPEHWNHFHFDLRSRKSGRAYCG